MLIYFQINHNAMGASEVKFQYSGTITFRKLDHLGVCFGIKGVNHLFFLHKTNNNYVKLNKLIKNGNKIKIYTYWNPCHRYNVKKLYLCDADENSDENSYDLTFKGKIKHIATHDELRDYYEIIFENKEHGKSFYIKNDNVDDNIIEGIKYNVYCDYLDTNKYEIKKMTNI